jgi:hypothetical protein
MSDNLKDNLSEYERVRFGETGLRDSETLFSNIRRSPFQIINQYSDKIKPYLFIEYKTATEERKKEIEEEVFTVLREVNELPRMLVSVEDGLTSEQAGTLAHLMLTPLAHIKANGSGYSAGWDGKDYLLNNAGVDFLYGFFPNIWHVTKKNAPLSIRDGFFTDKKLKRAIRKTLTYDDNIIGLIKWLRLTGLGYCVNFRPACAKALYEAHAPKENAKVYDYASGYGARCLGAYFSDNVTEYVSVDVNTETVERTHKLQEHLKKIYKDEKKSMTTYLCGSEEFLQKYPQYKGYFDLSFSSPQYFNTEVYCQEDTQSCHKYPQYEIWIRDFYKPTIFNAIDALKEGGVFIINIFEKLPEITKAGLDLKELTKIIAAKKGFYLYKCDRYLLRVTPGSSGKNEDGTPIIRDRKEEKFEAVWMFRHYKDLFKRGHITQEQYNMYEERHRDNSNG